MKKIFNPEIDGMTEAEMKIFFKVKNQGPQEEENLIIVPVFRPQVSAKVVISVESHAEGAPITTPN